MKQIVLDIIRRPAFRWLKQLSLVCRGLVYAGGDYACPCCGWRVRGFLGRAGVTGLNMDGYCPRCNAKARHRRDWLYLKAHTNVLKDRLRLLEIAPCPALARLFRRQKNLEFVGLDLDPRAEGATLAGDAAAMPLASGSIDAAVCIHVLEHVADDHAAIGELFRVLRPGGWALVSVPLLEDEPTREDPSVVTPEDRERIFGEPDHLRYYGTDFVDRLRGAGFQVALDPGSAVDPVQRRRHGLRQDENVFLCTKPASADAAAAA
jgi:SAM-dependent methyltransferase